jgi:hypothetical protein
MCHGAAAAAGIKSLPGNALNRQASLQKQQQISVDESDGDGKFSCATPRH